MSHDPMIQSRDMRCFVCFPVGAGSTAVFLLLLCYKLLELSGANENTAHLASARCASLERYIPAPFYHSQALSLNVPSCSRCTTRTWRPVNTVNTAAAAAAVSKTTSTKEAGISVGSHAPSTSEPAASLEHQVVSLDGHHNWRARGGSLAAAGLLALSLFVASADAAAADPSMPGSGLGCSTSTNPSYSMVSCERTGLDRDGRLLGCR